MRTKSKTLVCLLLGLVMLLSLAGFGIVAFADDVVGKQATADASAFDSNGWYTQAAYQALEDKTYALREGAALVGQPSDGYLGYVAPEAAQGYTQFASFAEGKIMNNKKLSVNEPISLEIGIQADGGHSWRMFNLYDSDSVGTKYYASTEANTPFGVLIHNNADKAEVYINGTKQTLVNEADVVELSTNNTKTLTQGTYIMHYVNIEIGADKTQVFIDDVLIGEFADVTRTSFPSGTVNAVMHFSGGGGAPWVAASAFNPFTVFKSSVASGTAVKALEWDQDITLNLTGPAAKVSVTNAKGQVVELTKDTDYTVSGNTVTLKATAIRDKEFGFYPLNTQFVITSEDERTTTFGLTIQYADPPALVTEQTAPQMVAEDLTADLAIGVTYERDETYTVLLDGEALETEDYTAAWAANTITLKLKKELINGLEQGLHTFELQTMAGSVEYKVFRKTAQNEWVNADTMDEKTGGVTGDGAPESVTKDGAGNTTVHMGMLSRVYYSEPIDLSETLYLELDINKLEKGSGHGWFVIGLTSDITQLATFSEAATKNYLSFLYDHTKGEFQCPNFVSDLPTQAKPEYINQNGPQLFSFTITKEGTVVTFNGKQIWNTDVWTLDSFAGGKAYLGIFSGTGTLDITTRTNPASPAANTYGLEYTLGANTDVSFDMYNTTAVSAVKYGDEALTANTDYTFADGKLTIKGSYLQTIAYADVMRFTVVADGVELKANIKALCEVSADKSAVAAVGENGAVFENAFDGKTVTSVVDMDTMEELTSSQFTFEGGKLTVAKEYFTENKTYSFAVVAGDDLYFAMAIAEKYENGWAQKGGTGTGTYDDGVFSVKGEGNYLSEQLFDLTEGEVSYTLTIDALNGYYLNGKTGSSNAHVAVYLYDLYSGNTLTVEIHANDDPETAQAGAYLGYVVLSVRDKNGNNVYVNNTAIADSTNYHDGSVIGENTIGFRYEGNSLIVTLNDTEYSFLNGIGNTVLTDLRMGVSATADVGDAQNAFSIRVKDGGSAPSEPGDSTWIIIVCVVAAVVVAGAVAAVVIVRKKKAGKTSGKDGQDE